MKLEEKQEILKTGDFSKLSVEQAKEWLKKIVSNRQVSCRGLTCSECILFNRDGKSYKCSSDFIKAKLQEIINTKTTTIPNHNGDFTQGKNSVCFGMKEPTKSPKIKFRLVKFEKALAFQILEMDERFRCKDSFVSRDGFKICSHEDLDLDKNQISLRGEDHSCDLIVSSIYFDSNADRDIHFDKMLIALKDWAENWEGFKENESIPGQNDNDIYEF